MKYLITIILLILTNSSFAQTIFTVNGFSDDYYGKVYIADTSKVFSKGWIAIYNQKNNKPIIKVTSDELAYDLHDGKIKANIHVAPYGEQSLIMYKDFDFDGKKDFAIEDGQKSCYHGPSFNIYLATDTEFEFSESFSRLAHYYCGMFQVDNKEKTIHAMTKDGCCRHQFVTFKVQNNQPQIFHSLIIDQSNGPYNVTTEIKRNHNRMDTTITREINLHEKGVKKLFSFELKNGKKVILFGYNGRTLNYVLLNKSGQVEFSYPGYEKYDYGETDFELPQPDNSRATILFTNKDAHYTIYENKGNKPKVGILVNTKGKTYDLKGIPESKTGGILKLRPLSFDNMLVETRKVNPTGTYKWNYSSDNYPVYKAGYIKVMKLDAHRIALSLTVKKAENNFITLNDTLNYQNKMAIYQKPKSDNRCQTTFKFTNKGVFVNKNFKSPCKGLKVRGYFRKTSVETPRNMQTLYGRKK